MADKCKHEKKILGKGIISEIDPDAEPFKSGQEIEMGTIYGGGQVLVRYCLDCEKIIEAWVE